MAAKKSQKNDAHADLNEAENTFYRDVIKQVAALTNDHDVLLNIPVWGHTGHGKTSSILTAIRYCQPHIHGMSLALVGDSDELEPIAAKYDQMKLSELRSMADATRRFLGDMQERFFRDNEWPDATETPAQHLLEVQAVSGTLGYLVIPDLRGGSYETADDTSKNAMSNAHAMVLLVKPTDYADESAAGSADYRKEVLRRIQRCAQASIPTCVMITMSDAFGDAGDAADRTEKELSLLLSGQASGFNEMSKLIRVSAIGRQKPRSDLSKKPPAAPPPANQRKPDALVEAWIWTLRKALEKPRDELRKQPPQIDLRADLRGDRVDAPTVPTLRNTRTTKAPGAVVCCLGGDAQGDSYLFRDPSGKLLEVRLEHEQQKLDPIREWKGADAIPAGAVFSVAGGSVAAGARANATGLFHSAGRGQIMAPASLPVPLQSWTLVEPRRVIGISNDGTIHSLHLHDNAWEDTHHVSKLFAPSPAAVCGYVPAERLALVVTGADTFGVDVTSKWRFGDIRKPAVPARFEAGNCQMNQVACFAVRLGDASLVVGREKQITLGPTHPEWGAVALADSLPLVAWVTPAARLRAAVFGKKPAATTDEFSPTLEAAVTGLCWNGNGDEVVVTLENGTLLSFDRRGF